MSGKVEKEKFGRGDVQQNDASKDYPGNSWIDRDAPFYDPWTQGANGIDPSSIEVMTPSNGYAWDADEAHRNTQGAGRGGKDNQGHPVAGKPWLRPKNFGG